MRTPSLSSAPRGVVQAPVSFPSQGATLRGFLLTPAATANALPAVIMAHGTSATIPMVALEYARVFAAAGLAVLIYDHRNFGISDGEPRQEINPWIQSRGYVDALTFMAKRPEVDAERIALWGDSYTGGQVVLVGACDPRVKAVVGQVPVFGQAPPPIPPAEGTFETIRETLASGDVTGTPETTTGPIPVVSPDQLGSPSLLAPIQAFRWFLEYGGRPGSGWLNVATRVLPATPVAYSPFLCAPFLKVPVLLMVAPEDEMVHANYEVARQAYELIPGPKRWSDVADGHFGLLYHPGRRFDEVTALQTQYLQAQLLG